MPSYTTWTRLEPRTRDPDLRDGLRAAVHDPLWLLGRQWQTGELQGEDGGSLVDVDVELTVDRLARGRAGGVSGVTASEADVTGADTVFGEGDDPPLETLVERERVRPSPDDDERDVRLAAEAGSHFLRLVNEATETAVEVRDFPASLRLSSVDRDDATADDDTTAGGDATTDDEAATRYTSVVAGRMLDGDELVRAYDFETFGDFEAAVTGAEPPPLPESLDLSAGDDASRRAFWAAIERYREWYATLYSQPAPSTDTDREADAWDDSRQEYRYAVSVGAGERETVLETGEYEGGRLDWYSFDVADGETLEPADWSGPASEHHTPPHGSADVTNGDREPLVPTPTSFEGMPAERWWEFEDGGVDLSAVEAAPEDLSKLLLLEFALVYGNDWFTLPVDLPVGSFARVSAFELTTTFGDRVTVDDATVAGDDPTGDWNAYAFAPSGGGEGDESAAERGLFLPPTVVETLESDAVESVAFTRDESANVAWAVESTVEGGVGQPRDRDEEATDTGERAPVATATAADVAYDLATDVPDNWFPLLPRRHGLGDVTFDLGRLLDTDEPTRNPLGRVLETTTSLPEEEVTRAGKTVERRYATTRGSDGSVHLWSGRTVGVGGQNGSSGLAFDDLVDPRTVDDEPAVGDPEPFPDAEPVAPTAHLVLSAVAFDTPGGPREHLDRETVELANAGGDVINLSGWTVADAAGHDYTFAQGTTLAAGGRLTLHTGEGTDTDTDRFWGRKQAVWNDTGDTVHVFDAAGELVLMRLVPERPPEVEGESLVLAAIVADPTGPDTDPTAEYLRFENASGGPLDLSGWRVEDAAGHSYTVPPGTELAADASLTLYTGVGDDSGSTLYWGRGSAVWNNDGDTVSVFDTDGSLVLRQHY